MTQGPRGELKLVFGNKHGLFGRFFPYNASDDEPITPVVMRQAFFEHHHLALAWRDATRQRRASRRSART